MIVKACRMFSGTETGGIDTSAGASPGGRCILIHPAFGNALARRSDNRVYIRYSFLLERDKRLCKYFPTQAFCLPPSVWLALSRRERERERCHVCVTCVGFVRFSTISLSRDCKKDTRVYRSTCRFDWALTFVFFAPFLRERFERSLCSFLSSLQYR